MNALLSYLTPNRQRAEKLDKPTSEDEAGLPPSSIEQDNAAIAVTPSPSDLDQSIGYGPRDFTR